jgi:hypothetical protein
MLSDALSWRKKVQLEAGYVVVLETAGRSGHWNPHLHILMTSGGMTPQKRWREVEYFPFEVLHKKWQYHLFTMVKHRVGTRAIRGKIDVLWRKYSRGLVAYLEEGKVPAGGEGLAYYLAKYVVSPPIGRVPAGCGYCFGTSPKPSARGQSAGHPHAKPVFKTPSMFLGLYLSTLSPSTPRSSTGILF